MLQRKEYALEAASVDIVSENIVSFLTDAKIGHDIIVQNRLFAEEILLGWIDADISASFQLVMGQRFGKTVVSLESAGRSFNVFDQGAAESSILLKNLTNSLGRYPDYSYVNGKNIVQLTFPEKKKNKLLQILMAIGFAVAIGLVFKYILPDFNDTVLTELINPLYSAAFRVLGFISGPLIFLSVMWGIYGIGDASTLNLVGKKMIFRFLLVIFAIAALISLTFPLMRFDMGSSAGNHSSFKSILEMFLDIIPPNIAEPFYSGNTLHIIFCAVVFGVAMLYLGKRVSTVAELVEQINSIVQFLVTFISKLMPYFVFLVVLRMVMNDTLSAFSSVWQLFAVFTAAALLLCSVFTMVISVKHKVSPLTIIKKSVPTFLIAITTASSSAAFSSNMETSEKKFGIDSSLCAFGIPLGMVMFKTSTTAYYVLVSFFFAKKFGVTVSPEWLVSVAFVSATLAIATPPIPGGGVAAYTMLFSRLGIPDEALAIVLSVDIIFDFIRTAANMYNLPLALVNISSTMGKLNVETLRKEVRRI